eukprot:snap_masked-scaffold1679_size31325-processed-gene-0.0 protein:Tk02945 transcript:snap_masked-scaffold1679_size31325-processed-gene-0.0-mRNA-1 annotation:"equilibrative nucleoside transporter 3"
MYYTGLVILLPWNILITVNGYWDYKFRNTTQDEIGQDQTQVQKEFTAYLSIAANVPNAIFVIVHALIGHWFSMRLRILGSQGSASANVGKFPVPYIGNMVSGAGMGGLLPSVVNCIILAIEADFQIAGFYCFLFAEILAIVCLALSIYLERIHFYDYYSTLERPLATFNPKEDIGTYIQVFKDAWIYILTNLINFTTTLAVFPGVMVLVEPVHNDGSPWATKFFVPVVCFIVYNLSDYIGKHLAAWIQWPSTSKLSQWLLLLAALCRIALIPLIMFCNVSPSMRKTEIIFHSDALFIVFNVILAISNGYIGNLAMMFGPKVVKPELQEITSAMLIAALVIGCGVGSMLGILISNLVHALDFQLNTSMAGEVWREFQAQDETDGPRSVLRNIL